MSMRESIMAALVSGPQPDPEGAVGLEFRFPSHDPTFAGHFPTRPVLPGVFQLELVRLAAELVLHCSLGVREITKAKFLRPIAPNELVRVELKLSENDNMIQARASFIARGRLAGEASLQLSRDQNS